MSEVIFEGKRYKDIDADAQNAMRATNIHTFRYYPNDKIWMASDVTVKKFGVNKFYKIDEYEDGPDIIYTGDKHKDLALYQEIIGGKDIASCELRSYDGESYYKVTLAALERDDEGNVTVIAGIIEDFDAQMKQTALVQMLADDYRTVYHVNFIKNQVEAFKMPEFIERNFGDTMKTLPTYESIISSYIEECVVDEEKAEMHQVTSYDNLAKQLSDNPVFMHDYRIIRDGKISYVRCKVVKLNEGPALERVVMGFADVSRDKDARLEHLAFFDQVTLGNNFNYYSEKLKNENDEGYIVSLDIRDFRVINDTCGIAKGDDVLRKVNKIVEKAVGDDGFFGHVNGDHFVIFLNYKEDDKVVDVLQNITAEFKELVKENNIPKIAPYFGVSRWKPGDRIQVMFSQANSAKHRIKDKGDINYGFYRKEDTAAELEKKQMEDSFEEAIAESQFEIWYQPKYSPIDRELTGAEALVRWRKPDGNLVPPGKFIPVFEKNGMIKQLDEYVFRNVCKQQQKWIEEFGKTIPVSINLSRASLFYEGIVREYKEIADSMGVPTKLVPIEITESAAISNSDIKMLADKFYEAGFPLHIDDFGTGYSSLSTLNLMKFDTLKLDKSLVDFIGEFGGDRLIKHTVALAKDMGLHVTAEGVEHDSQVVFLKQVDCDNIQGYIYSKPIPCEEFEQKLKAETISPKYIFSRE